ncbi:MAG: hypothetical protein ACP5E5_05645 [Acidobacteriaceae bacterium]
MCPVSAGKHEQPTCPGAACVSRIEPEHPTRTVPNPERRALDKQIRAARTELSRLERQHGAAAADNPEHYHPTMRGFKIAHGKLGQQLRAARDRLCNLRAQRRRLPERVLVRDLGEQSLLRLATECKHLTDLIKMLAYQDARLSGRERFTELAPTILPASRARRPNSAARASPRRQRRHPCH